MVIRRCTRYTDCKEGLGRGISTTWHRLPEASGDNPSPGTKANPSDVRQEVTKSTGNLALKTTSWYTERVINGDGSTSSGLLSVVLLALGELSGDPASSLWLPVNIKRDSHHTRERSSFPMLPHGCESVYRRAPFPHVTGCLAVYHGQAVERIPDYRRHHLCFVCQTELKMPVRSALSA